MARLCGPSSRHAHHPDSHPPRLDRRCHQLWRCRVLVWAADSQCRHLGCGGAVMPAMSIGAEFEAEYYRQAHDEGYDPDHDDTHREGELACAAVAYAMPEWLNEWMDKNDIKIWPFEGEPKFKDRRRDLVRAGALLIAEIARLDREISCASTGSGNGR